ncbi:hypothetical protein SARC_06406 [Sphaeroforma arctica JP610]|uniref:Dynamin-like GTPase OPA1 C-terminal domain-containing protein n=1 Tax=Sphaeroforma arctica JP610 TaxID=667725 RepID=A0A0L0FWP4_9EUKA|nr:hypothetical protein SARC_06406 [Sphaeroforma arctica JP610]KNC81260.1 hypothetical protein SARC_06406 [Sphaeroforma arctica JP610]|eukprot:XP_014155162.1 hypothetical protein SARC_06406 [Sphaeroforma arctica JP610]
MDVQLINWVRQLLPCLYLETNVTLLHSYTLLAFLLNYLLIYLPLHLHTYAFTQTRVDVQLIDWARRSLPQECVALARQTFMDRFDECVRGDGKSSLKDSPDIFVALKEKIVSDSMQKHAWHRDVSDNLRVIQTNSLEDDEITDAGQWYLAVDFMQNKLQREATAFSSKMREYFGPGWTERWFYWTSGTSEQAIHASIASELGAFFKPERDGAIPKAKLHHDSIITVRNNILQNTGEHVSDAQIIDVYNKLYTGEFLSRSVQSASYCKSKYSSNSRDAPNGLKCKDVVMFWRVQEMLHVTAKTLRQQIMYHQAKLEAEVKQHLDVLSESEASKKELISSERVELAQQIEVRRHLLQSLDGFIQTISIKANAT